MAIVFDVVAKACTEATSLLKLCCMATSGGFDLPLGAGAAGFDFAVGGGCIYTRSAEGGYLKWVFGGLGSGSGVQFQGN